MISHSFVDERTNNSLDVTLYSNNRELEISVWYADGHFHNVMNLTKEQLGALIILLKILNKEMI